jgi:DNA repair exonuclease SbcCD ATPase subunit
MKKSVFFVLGIIILSACHDYKKDAQSLMMAKDSLEQVTAFKDSSIASFLSDFSEIQANLDSIKQLEKIVSVQSGSNRELNANQKQAIIEDLAMLHQLLQKNKELTASFQKKLKNANLKITDLNETIAGLELMVKNMEAQANEQDIVIADLTTEVKKLNVDITQLNQKILEIENVSQQKSQIIDTQMESLNKAYYAFGTMKELRDNGIIEKSGGLIGIGKTAVMKKDFNRDYFTEIDIRNFDFLRLMAKKAELITVHPEGSYHFTGKKGGDTLFIDNTSEFWKASKYLVVLTD